MKRNEERTIEFLDETDEEYNEARLSPKKIFIVGLVILSLEAFVLIHRSSDNKHEAHWDSVRGSLHGIDVPSDDPPPYDKINFISNAADGAADEIQYIGPKIVSEIETELLNSMKVTEINMTNSLSDLLMKFLKEKMNIEELESLQDEAVERLEEKEFEKLESSGDLAISNAINNIENVVKKYMSKSNNEKPVVDILREIENEEKKSQTGLKEIVENESDHVIVNLDEDAKDVIKGIILDLFGTKVSSIDVDNAYDGAKTESQEEVESLNTSSELNEAADEIEEIGMEVVSEIEDELLDNMEKTELKMITSIRDLLLTFIKENINEKDLKSLQEEAIEHLEEKEVNKLDHVGKMAIGKAKNNIGQIVKKHTNKERKDSNIGDILNEFKSQNGIIHTVTKESDKIMITLDEDARSVAKGILEDLLGVKVSSRDIDNAFDGK